MRRLVPAAALIVAGAIAQTSVIGGGGGSGKAPYYSSLFSSVSSATVPGATHGFTAAPCGLVVMVYDNSTPRQLLTPNGSPPVTVDPVTCDVVVRFSAATSFYVAINGGAGPQGSAGAAGPAFNPLDRTVFWKIDNFCGGEFPSTTVDVVGEMGWHLGVTNAGSASISNLLGTDLDANHPCGVKLVSPASTGNGSYLELFGGVLASAMAAGSLRPTTIEYHFKISSTSNIKFYLSFLSAAPYSVSLGNSTAGCWLRYDTSLGTPDTGWMAACSDSAAQTVSALAGTLDTNIHRVTLTWTAAGSFSMAMDGGTPTVISKAIPSSSQLKTGVAVSNDGTSTTSAAYVYKFVVQQSGLVVN